MFYRLFGKMLDSRLKVNMTTKLIHHHFSSIQRWSTMTWTWTYQKCCIADKHNLNDKLETDLDTLWLHWRKLCIANSIRPLSDMKQFQGNLAAGKILVPSILSFLWSVMISMQMTSSRLFTLTSPVSYGLGVLYMNACRCFISMEHPASAFAKKYLSH